jgi:hypothetical protein
MKRKFESYVGADIYNLKRQRLFDRWVEKANDWQLIDELEHGWLHKLPRGELEALVRKHINPEEKDGIRAVLELFDEEARQAHEFVVSQMDGLDRYSRLINFLKSANRPFKVYLNWHYTCTILIKRITMRHDWTPIDFKSNHIKKAQQVAIGSFEVGAKGDRCHCRDDQPDKVHPAVDGLKMGSAPITFQAEVLQDVFAGLSGQIEKGTMVTFCYDDSKLDYRCSVEGNLLRFWNPHEAQDLEPEIWMNETLGFCPPVWKLVMDYAKTNE